MPDGSAVTIETAHLEVNGERVAICKSSRLAPMCFSPLPTPVPGSIPRQRNICLNPSSRPRTPTRVRVWGFPSFTELWNSTGASLRSVLNRHKVRHSGFICRKPRRPDHRAPQKRQSLRPRAVTTVTRVLLVEDEEVVRNLIAQMLRNCGFTVLEAATPRKAIQLVQDDTEGINMLLADAIMTEMRGPELAKTITSMRPEIKIAVHVWLFSQFIRRASPGRYSFHPEAI